MTGQYKHCCKKARAEERLLFDCATFINHHTNQLTCFNVFGGTPFCTCFHPLQGNKKVTQNFSNSISIHYHQLSWTLDKEHYLTTNYSLSFQNAKNWSGYFLMTCWHMNRQINSSLSLFLCFLSYFIVGYTARSWASTSPMNNHCTKKKETKIKKVLLPMYWGFKKIIWKTEAVCWPPCNENNLISIGTETRSKNSLTSSPLHQT